MGTAPGVARSAFKSLSTRYRDAYAVATGTIRFGNLVKKWSLIAAAAITVITLYFGISNHRWGLEYNWFAILLGLLVAGATVATGFISGTFLAAQGQFMSAMLDTAVNTSPHLHDPEKASIMML